MNIKLLLVFLSLFTSINLGVIQSANARYYPGGGAISRSYHHGNDTGDYTPFWFFLFTFVGGAIASANND